MDRTTTTMRVSNGRPPLLLPSLIPFLLFLPLPRIVSCCKASALGGLSPSLSPSSQIPDAGLRAATAALSMSHFPACASNSCAIFPEDVRPLLPIDFVPWFSSVYFFRHTVHLNRVSRLIRDLLHFCAVVFVESSLSAKLPNPAAPGVPCSDRIGGLGYVHVHRVLGPLEKIHYSHYRRCASVSSVRLDILKIRHHFPFLASKSSSH